ncbi:MAG: hypothetical protein IPL86_02155 [Flavobacteriales bacterium]|nr:hypothetical protein [Flavobacteriales bacterium]
MAATPPPLVPERAPWEISVLGGMFSSTTKYSGSNSADWNANISKANSVGMGAELMHMGRNFGIGAGLHYATYAEQLRTEALDRTTFTLQNFWYLNPVDTTILVITDTIPGTPPTYTGTSTNTTVNVLTQGTDTTNKHGTDPRSAQRIKPRELLGNSVTTGCTHGARPLEFRGARRAYGRVAHWPSWCNSCAGQ